MESHPKSGKFLLTSLCSRLGRVAFLPKPRTTATNVTAHPGLSPLNSFLMYKCRFWHGGSGFKDTFQSNNTLQEKKRKRVVALVRSSEIVEEDKWGWNCSRITLCHLSFPIALVTLWQAWDLQHRRPSLLRLSWVPSDHFPWDAMQITLSGFAF